MNTNNNNPETKQDRINEIRVINKFCRKYNFQYKKLGQFDLDFELYKNKKPIAYAEIKCRTHHFNQFETQFISVKRYNEFKEYSKKKPCVLIVQYTDGIYFVNTKKIPKKDIKVGGRKNPRPNMPNDIEPLVHFKRSLFKKM